MHTIVSSCDTARNYHSYAAIHVWYSMGFQTFRPRNYKEPLGCLRNTNLKKKLFSINMKKGQSWSAGDVIFFLWIPHFSLNFPEPMGRWNPQLGYVEKLEKVAYEFELSRKHWIMHRNRTYLQFLYFFSTVFYLSQLDYGIPSQAQGMLRDCRQWHMTYNIRKDKENCTTDKNFAFSAFLLLIPRPINVDIEDM